MDLVVVLFNSLSFSSILILTALELWLRRYGLRW